MEKKHYQSPKLTIAELDIDSILQAQSMEQGEGHVGKDPVSGGIYEANSRSLFERWEDFED